MRLSDPRPEFWLNDLYQTIREVLDSLSELEAAFNSLASQIENQEKIQEAREALSRACILTAQHAVALLMTSTSWAVQGSNHQNGFPKADFGYFALDREWRLIYMDGMSEQIFQRLHKDLDGKVLWEAIPELKGSEVHCRLAQIAENNQRDRFQCPFLHLELVDFDVYPYEEKIDIVFRREALDSPIPIPEPIQQDPLQTLDV